MRLQIEGDKDVIRCLKLWAVWICDGKRALDNLGLPSMSIEQTAAYGKGSGQKPLPAWSIQTLIDGIINQMPNHQKCIIFAAHKIPVTIQECQDMNIAICCLSRYKDSQDCYQWPSNLGDARKALGLGRYEFDRLYHYILGEIGAQLKINEKIA